jgi:D-sedoheptulose 7-phosphate isomerase
MNEFAGRYFNGFRQALESISVTGRDGKGLAYAEALVAVTDLAAGVKAAGKKVMMVGNGGSAGICSHQAVDYWKNGGIRAMAFNDASLLTCISNDYSYEEVFSKPIGMFAEKGDVLFCISSSGSSANILRAAAAGKAAGCSVITFSGFKADNPLRGEGSYNFYVDSFSYGFVEILHLFIIHSILDAHLYVGEKVDVFNRNLPME